MAYQTINPCTERELDRHIPAALLILRFFLALFLLQWSIEKLILPNATASIAQNFYGVTLAAPASYALGVAELVLSLALLFGLYRTISYGLSLLIHTVTVIVSWRELLDPWGLAKVGSHLWLSTWPTWGGFMALFLMRAWDTWTIDGWHQSRGALPMDQATRLYPAPAASAGIPLQLGQGDKNNGPERAEL